MSEPLRRAYLEAMGIDVWLLRPQAPDRDRLLIGPGEGSTLLVCDSAADSSGKLAGDIGRALGGSPVWSWPVEEAGTGERLADAIEQLLFTRIIVFGHALAWQLFGGEAPAVMGSASVAVASSLEDLATRGSARRDLWRLLCGEPASG